MPLNPSGSESGLKSPANEKGTHTNKIPERTITILKLLMCVPPLVLRCLRKNTLASPLSLNSPPPGERQSSSPEPRLGDRFIPILNGNVNKDYRLAVEELNRCAVEKKIGAKPRFFIEPRSIWCYSASVAKFWQLAREVPRLKPHR